MTDWLSPEEHPLEPQLWDGADYLDRMGAVQPSLMLRRVADQFPEFEWLCWLPAEERRFYMTVGDADYVRNSFFIHLPSWALKALTA